MHLKTADTRDQGVSSLTRKIEPASVIVDLALADTTFPIRDPKFALADGNFPSAPRIFAPSDYFIEAPTRDREVERIVFNGCLLELLFGTLRPRHLRGALADG